jgi:lysine biosynthesis protein LysW
VPTAICPECEGDVFVDAESEQGTIVTCDDCSSKLEVVGLDPLELDAYEGGGGDYEDEEDFDSYDYEDDRY